MSMACEPPAPTDLDTPFWRFSLAVYARPNVRQECLELQEKYGVDVNVVLFVAWIGAQHGARLDRPATEALTHTVRSWHEGVVKPLRAARRAIRALGASAPSGSAGLRARIAQEELAAEQIEQALLFASAPQVLGDGAPPDRLSRRETVAHNLALAISCYSDVQASDASFNAIATEGLTIAQGHELHATDTDVG